MLHLYGNPAAALPLYQKASQLDALSTDAAIGALHCSVELGTAVDVAGQVDMLLQVAGGWRAQVYGALVVATAASGAGDAKVRGWGRG